MDSPGNSKRNRGGTPEVRSLVGRCALVTGAGRGVGLAIRRALEREGADVYGVDLQGPDVLELDVATADGNAAMIAAVEEARGRLDILVLNAGVQFVAPIAELPKEQWDRLMNVMATGPFLAMQAAWPALTAKPGGRVIVTASLSSAVGAAQKAAYTAAKHAVMGLVRVAALEGAPQGLTVNAVAPGWIDTALVAQQLPELAKQRGVGEDEMLEELRGAQPAGRFVDAAEVAELVAFLASEGSSGISGACIPVDLGMGLV